MAAPTALYTSFTAGFYPNATAIHHEDFADIVTILDSFQTPAFSTAPKIRVRDIVHSWSVDTLAATATSTAWVDGDSFAGSTLTSPARLTNVCQVFRRDVGVSDRERAANPAGIRDMYQHQIMKEFKVIARNFESRIWAMTVAVSASATGADNSAGTRMGGIRAFSIITAVSASGVPTTADIVSLSKSLFQAGAEPDSLWFSPGMKQQFVNQTVSSGSGNVRNIAAVDQKLVANIDVFETPFGQLYAVITDRFIPESAAAVSASYYIGDRAMLKVGFFRPPQHKPMGKDGDNTRGIVLMDATIQLDHPSSWAAMSGVTN